MSLRVLLLLLALVLFGGYSVWALLQVGYIGIWASGFASPGTLQILIDLVISCLVFSSWMIADAKSRGVNSAPWLIAILTTGSIAILVYLLFREMAKKRELQSA